MTGSNVSIDTVDLFEDRANLYFWFYRSLSQSERLIVPSNQLTYVLLLQLIARQC
jgi:hypothetical protein